MNSSVTLSDSDSRADSEKFEPEARMTNQFYMGIDIIFILDIRHSAKLIYDKKEVHAVANHKRHCSKTFCFGIEIDGGAAAAPINNSISNQTFSLIKIIGSQSFPFKDLSFCCVIIVLP